MKTITTLTKPLLLFALFTICFNDLFAQTVTTPKVSQKATISQQVGITDITIIYHSPAVNERKIWGGLVPFNQVWRAGANENTIISFSDPVTIEGQILAAGSYGLYMKPKAESVDIIFSSATKNWGTVTPLPEEIVASVTVTPQEMPFQEWLSYDFLDREANSVTAALKWEKWLIPFKIEVDVPNIVLNNIRAELRGQAGFGYLGREQAARYCLNNDIALDEAMTWIDQSIANEKRFSNLTVKSNLLKKKGEVEEAEKVMQEALNYATPPQMNQYGYQLLNGGDIEGAIKIFLKNLENTPKSHPFYWGFLDSAGEAYLANGDKKNALKYYKMAKEYADENNQQYLDGVIQGIQDKK